MGKLTAKSPRISVPVTEEEQTLVKSVSDTLGIPTYILFRALFEKFCPGSFPDQSRVPVDAIKVHIKSGKVVVGDK